MSSEIMNKALAFKVGGEPTFAQRPKTLHQLGVNYRFSDLILDEQPAVDASITVSPTYKPEDPTVLRAGDRAPDAPGLLPVQLPIEDPANVKIGYASTTLFDIYKPTQHTALVFIGTMDVARISMTVNALKKAPGETLRTVFILPKDYSGSIGHLASALGGVSGRAEVFVDSEDHAHTFYPLATHGFSTIIVRPDAFVGAVVKGEEGLAQYLRLVFGDRATL